MSLNSDVNNYLKSIVPEWQSDICVTERFLRRVIRNINKTEEKISLASNIKSCELIITLETIIRVCLHIQDISRSHFQTNDSTKIDNILSDFKKKEFVWYKNVLQNLGVTKEPIERDFQSQITELVQLVKNHSQFNPAMFTLKVKRHIVD